MTPYNIIPLSIGEGLNNYEVGTAGGYIALIEAPANANVTIRLNSPQNAPIPLRNYHGIEAKGVTDIYVSADAIDGETIKLVQSTTADSFKMITPASDVNIGELGGYQALALQQLDKIFRPYHHPVRSYAYSDSVDYLTILSKTLTCDKIRLVVNTGNPQDVKGFIVATIGGQTVARLFSGTGTAGIQRSMQDTIEIENVRGEVLSISGYCKSSDTFFFHLEEFTLKD